MHRCTIYDAASIASGHNPNDIAQVDNLEDLARYTRSQLSVDQVETNVV